MSLALARREPMVRETVVTGARIRILLVTDTAILGRGGSERFLCHLLGGLDAARFEVDVVQLTEPLSEDMRLRPPPRGHHIRLEHRPIDAVYGARGRALYRELRQRVLAGRYDVVQSQHEKSDLLCALLPRKPGGPRYISNRRDTGFQKSRPLRHAFRLLNHRFDRFVAPSRAVLDGLVANESVPSDRTVCLPNGVDTERFAPLPMLQRAERRVAAGLPPHAFLFGSVARLAPVKRHCDLLAAYAQAAGERADVGLVLVGEGPLQAELRQQATRLGISGRVSFLGERRDIEQLLPLLDAFVLCSSTEGMSNAVLEAMACGLPVIATAVGGNPETVDRQTGLLVPPHAPERLAETMESLLEDPDRAREMGRRARQRVTRAFSIDAMVAGFSRLYHEGVTA